MESNKCYFFSTLRKPSVNRKDLRELTLVGPTRNNLALDPLAVHLHHENWLSDNDNDNDIFSVS